MRPEVVPQWTSVLIFQVGESEYLWDAPDVDFEHVLVKVVLETHAATLAILDPRRPNATNKDRETQNIEERVSDHITRF